ELGLLPAAMHVEEGAVGKKRTGAGGQAVGFTGLQFDAVQSLGHDAIGVAERNLAFNAGDEVLDLEVVAGEDAAFDAVGAEAHRVSTVAKVDVVAVVADLAAHVEAGETVSLLGRSGSGNASGENGGCEQFDTHFLNPSVVL